MPVAEDANLPGLLQAASGEFARGVAGRVVNGFGVAEEVKFHGVKQQNDEPAVARRG